MKLFLTKFSSFYNRYYTSATGMQSAEFLFETISEIAERSQHKIKVMKFAHKWSQFSIIARFEPHAASNETVIIGAHQDSINQFNRAGPAPGAGNFVPFENISNELFR